MIGVSEVDIEVAGGALWRDTQNLAGKLLKIAGDGVTDDSAAIQAAIDAVSTRDLLVFPKNKTIKLNSGLTIKAGTVGLDLNGCILDFTGMSSGVAITVNPPSAGSSGFESVRDIISNGVVNGPDTDVTTVDGIKFDRSTPGTGVVSGLAFRNLTINGFRDSVLISDGTYINFLYNVNIVGAHRYGVNYPALNYAGENISWFGGRVSDCQNATQTAIGIYLPENGANQLFLYGVSLDYNDTNLKMLSGRVKIFGGNLENNSATLPMVVVDATTPGNWAELVLASDVGGSEASPGRPVLISVSGDNAFMDISMCHFYSYEYTHEIINVVSGSPKINYRGAHVLATGGAAEQPAICKYASDTRQGQNDASPTASPWTATTGNVAVSVSTGTGVSGGNAIRGIWTGSASSNFQHRVNMFAGMILQAEAMVNVVAAAVGATIYFRIEFRDAAGGLIRRDNINRSNGDNFWSTTTGGFEKISTWRRAPSGTSYAMVDFWNGATTATIDVDEVYAWAL